MRRLFFILCAVFVIQMYACIPVQHRVHPDADPTSSSAFPTTPLTLRIRANKGLRYNAVNEFVVEMQSAVALEAVEFKLHRNNVTEYCSGQTQWSGALPAQKKQHFRFQCPITDGTEGYIEVSAAGAYAGSTMVGAGGRLQVGMQEETDSSGRHVAENVHLFQHRLP